MSDQQTEAEDEASLQPMPPPLNPLAGPPPAGTVEDDNDGKPKIFPLSASNLSNSGPPDALLATSPGVQRRGSARVRFVDMPDVIGSPMIAAQNEEINRRPSWSDIEADAGDASPGDASPPVEEGAFKPFDSEDGFFDERAIGRIAEAQAMHTKLSHQELRNIERCFTEFDEDGSGTIDLEELEKVMLAMGHALTEMQLEELLQQVDVNGSGALDFAEFVQLITLWKESSQFKLFDQGATTIQQQRIESSLRTELWMPESPGRLAWDAIIVVSIVYFWFTILLLITMNDHAAETTRIYLLPSDILLSVVGLVDIAVSFNTVVPTRLPSGQIACKDDYKSVAKAYATSWLVFDVLAVLPFNQFGSSHIVFRLLSLSRLLKSFKFFGGGMFRRSGRKHMTPNYVWFFYTVLPLAKIVVSFVMLVHILAVLWTVVKVFIGGSSQASFRSTKGRGDLDTGYITSLYLILATVTTNGYGDVAIEGPIQQGVACLLCIFASLVNGLVIGYIVSSLQKTDIKTERENKLRETLAVCQYFDIPIPLQDEILRFQSHVLEHNLSQAYTDLVRGLPQEMQTNINLYVRIRLVSLVPYFKNAHEGTKVALAQELVASIFRPEEYIIFAGETADCMYFISYGFVDIISPEGELWATLKQGGFFGEMALLAAGNKRSASAKALCYCDLFTLSRSKFLIILRRFPKFRQEIMAVSEQRRIEIALKLKEAKAKAADNSKVVLTKSDNTLNMWSSQNRPPPSPGLESNKSREGDALLPTPNNRSSSKDRSLTPLGGAGGVASSDGRSTTTPKGSSDPNALPGIPAPKNQASPRILSSTTPASGGPAGTPMNNPLGSAHRTNSISMQSASGSILSHSGSGNALNHSPSANTVTKSQLSAAKQLQAISSADGTSGVFASLGSVGAKSPSSGLFAKEPTMTAEDHFRVDDAVTKVDLPMNVENLVYRCMKELSHQTAALTQINKQFQLQTYDATGVTSPTSPGRRQGARTFSTASAGSPILGANFVRRLSETDGDVWKDVDDSVRKGSVATAAPRAAGGGGGDDGSPLSPLLPPSTTGKSE